VTLGLGYGLPNPAFAPFVPEGKICFWGGWGGSLVLVDAERRMTVSYVMNKMAPGAVAGPNAAELTAHLYQLLGRWCNVDPPFMRFLCAGWDNPVHANNNR